MTDLLSSVEQALTHPEGTWDALESSELATLIPVAGRFIKVWRGLHDYRAALFAAKLRAFIMDPALQTPEARAFMRQRAESAESKKIGESLFLVIEQLNDIQKPAWLAKCFAAYLAGEITASEFRRLASAIAMAFGDDLIALLTTQVAYIGGLNEEVSASAYPWVQSLVASGLTQAGVHRQAGLRFVYSISALGEQFRKAVRAHHS